jgi:hypothetical protein
METSKEKAKEILQRHYNKIQEVTAGMFDDDAPTHDLVYRAAKECAKIEIDAMIIQNGELYLANLGEKANEFYRKKNAELFEIKKEIDNV